MFIKLLSCFFLSTISLAAGPQHAKNYDEAASLAKQQEVPYVVFIHGSSWHKASKTFLDQLWNDSEIRQSVGRPFIYTDIHIKQGLSEEQAKKELTTRETWKNTRITGYPAIQVYSHDGTLLVQFQGSRLRNFASKKRFATLLKRSLSIAAKRHSILQQIKKAQADKEPEQELQLIGKLVSLPLEYDKKAILAQLKELDPQDETGWQARVSFDNWSYIRHVSSLIRAEKAGQALTETDDRLSKEYYTPLQRAFLLSAKGEIIATTGDYKKAWSYFKQASELAPNNPHVDALLRYGERVAMMPLRAGFRKGSELYDKNVGENVSQGHATFTMSSIAYDDKSRHDSLFNGPYLGGSFHTNREKTAHIIIDLKAVCTVKAVQILNIGGQNAGRAKTLTLFTSKDQKKWTKVWQAEKAQPEWHVLLDKPADVQYLKLALDSEQGDFLHLNGVNVFGERL